MNDAPSGVRDILSIATLPAGPRRYPWWHWRRLGLNFLTGAILAHIFFAIGASYLIVQTVQTKRVQNFAAAPRRSSAPTQAIEHKVQMQKKQQTMSALAQMKRITTTAPNTEIALPALPAMPSPADIKPVTMAGMGDSGVSLGTSNSSSGPSMDSGSGGKPTFFGFHADGGGLAGTLYDLKQTSSHLPTPIAKRDMGGEGVGLYDALVQRFVREGWNTDLFDPYFRSATVLYTNWIYIPNDESGEAAKAFNLVGQVKGDRWLVLYKGRVRAPKNGTFRFVGRGDNVLIVRLDTRTIFDGSQPRLIPEAVAEKAVGPGGGPGWQMAAGPWFRINMGQELDLHIIIGDTGGLFSDFLLIEEKGATYAKRKDAPQYAAYPLFQTSANSPPAHIVNKTNGVNPEVAATPIVFPLVSNRFGVGF